MIHWNQLSSVRDSERSGKAIERTSYCTIDLESDVKHPTT